MNSVREPAYGAKIAGYFRVPSATSLLIEPVAKPPVAITRLVSDIGLPERTQRIPEERAFIVSVHLTPPGITGCECWEDDRYWTVMDWPVGGVGIFNLEAAPHARNHGPVDWVHYYVPRATLDTFAADEGFPRITTLKGRYGAVDPVLHRLTQVILPSLDASRTFSNLFLDYFRLLVCAHLAQSYAASFHVNTRPRGSLAPWQEQRVAEMLAQHLDGTLLLKTLAGQCGLSVSHFARAFRRTFGTPPHQYLILQRVERAKVILARSDCALSDVSQQAGFSDQAAFTRTFKAVVGITPGQWRRQQGIRRSIKEA